nr:MAG TPA: hypothetical protein [Crassvirales sp.]DAK96666.1 MAG TPA: hypothetical protein [Bacteriophage sp.]
MHILVVIVQVKETFLTNLNSYLNLQSQLRVKRMNLFGIQTIGINS